MLDCVKCIFTIWLLSVAHLILGQAQFQNKSQKYLAAIPVKSVMPGAAIDINGDLIDDIVALDKGVLLKTIKSFGGNFSLELQDSLKVAISTEWSMTAGDINNDGTMDVITSGENNQSTLVPLKRNNLTKKSFATGVYAQGSNTVDINRDGWLDYFLCNDSGHSKIYINDQKGNLKLTTVIDFSINDLTDGSGNYNSEWIDVNNDFLPDLCIAKCKAGVTDPTDLRRVNRLYINQGNGQFVESGAAYQLNSGAQSWVTVFGDLDNDGDQDALVVNHYAPHELMENIEGKTFVKRPLPDQLSTFSFQACVRDFDNDGWLDIMMTGVEGSLLLHNKGNFDFEIIRHILGPIPSRSMTCGDYNDDGYLDVYTHLGDPINEVGQFNNQLWLNSGGDHHFIKFNLEGSASNRTGIGAHLTLYGTWGKQVRYVKGGESYGIFNSLQQVFGLGGATEADSLVVVWPSGIKEVYKTLDADQTYYIQENKCMTRQMALYAQPIISKDTNVTLVATANMKSYQWSNGATTAQATANNGNYFVIMTDSLGCKTISKPIDVVSGCFAASADLLPGQSNIKGCEGNAIDIFPIIAQSYLWHDGSTSDAFQGVSTGWVSLTAQDYCGHTLSDSVFLDFYKIDLNVQPDTIKKGEQAKLVADHPNTQWFASSDWTKIIHVGDTLITDPLIANTVFKAQAVEEIDHKTSRVGPVYFPSSNFYDNNNAAGALLFEVEKKCVIRSIMVNTDTPGKRKIVITNSNNKVVFEKVIDIKDGITKVILDAELTPDNYTIKTDETFNKENLGFVSPRLVRTVSSTHYPYQIKDVLTILSSTFGANYYMYFYDWEVDYEIVYCESELKEVIVIVEDDINSIDEALTEWKILPNPGYNEFAVQSPYKIDKIEIFDLVGFKLNACTNCTKMDNLDGLRDGIYAVAIQVKGRWYYTKWLKAW
jgi:hypothetical protein